MVADGQARALGGGHVDPRVGRLAHQQAGQFGTGRGLVAGLVGQGVHTGIARGAQGQALAGDAQLGDAALRRLHLGFGLVQLFRAGAVEQLAQLGVGAVHTGAGLVAGGAGAVEVGDGHLAAFVEGGDAGEAALGVGQLGLVAGQAGTGRVDGFVPGAVAQLVEAGTGGGQVALRFGQAGIGAARVEFQQHLAGADLFAFGHVPGQDRLGGLGRYGDAVPFQGAEQLRRCGLAGGQQGQTEQEERAGVHGRISRPRSSRASTWLTRASSSRSSLAKMPRQSEPAA